MPETVALTGATGFIGSHILRVLVHAGHRVHALTRRPMPASPGITWVTGDLSSSSALTRLVSGATVVVHCAGAVRGASAAEFDRINVAGTANLLAAAQACTPRPRFLLISSLAAREPGLSWYARSKAQAESLLAQTGTALAWTILRPTAVYGPGDRELKPLFQWMLRGLLPWPQPRQGRLSLLHVSDLASAVLAWVNASRIIPGTYELGDGTPGGYGAEDMAGIACAHTGRPVRVVPLPRWILSLLGRANLSLARPLGLSPMLTPGKVRELVHPDWRAHPGPFMDATGWAPRVRLGDALQSGLLFFT